MSNPSTLPPYSANGERRDQWLATGVCIFLALLAWIVFGQTRHHEFVNFDDDVDVYQNPVIRHGLTPSSLHWAFTHTQVGDWDPLTEISHMLDCQLFGLNAGGHHLTSLFSHAAAAMFLFLALRQMTAALWRSAFVAAVFAIHPLHVESVAWVAERKDVLSAFFFTSTLLAYGWSARQPQAISRRVVVTVLFALGLLSKAMVITLPCVLLLLDFWPLNRVKATASFSRREWGAAILRLIVEKLPLFVLSAVSAVITLLAIQSQLAPLEKLPFSWRLGNALVSYVGYLWQMLYPARLAAFYPHPGNRLPIVEACLAALLLLLISALAFHLRERRPYFLVGWLWYLGMLVPVIGLIQSGALAHADRYTYLPGIGITLLLTWGSADLTASWPHRRVVLATLAAAILATLAWQAALQVSFWRNSETLWRHTLACTSANGMAHNNLGNALLQKGAVEEAVQHFHEALAINPAFALPHNNLGNVLEAKGRLTEARDEYRKALEIQPDYAQAENNLGNILQQEGRGAEAILHLENALKSLPDSSDIHYNLANALLQTGKVNEAISQYQQAIEENPTFADAQINLGNVFAHQGQWDQAIACLRQALRARPADANAHNNLGNAFMQTGQQREALGEYEQAVELDPRSATALRNLAWVLATAPEASLRDGRKALEFAERAAAASPGANPFIDATLAAAYAESGRFDDAKHLAQQAIATATAARQEGLVPVLRAQLKLYEANQPLRDSGQH